jgi:hypothetical protein
MFSRSVVLRTIDVSKDMTHFLFFHKKRFLVQHLKPPVSCGIICYDADDRASSLVQVLCRGRLVCAKMLNEVW